MGQSNLIRDSQRQRQVKYAFFWNQIVNIIHLQQDLHTHLKSRFKVIQGVIQGMNFHKRIN